MDSARWEQMQAIFHEAAARPEGERQAYLESACGADPALLNEVRKMLEADQGSAPLLDDGLPEVAYQMVGGPFQAESFRAFGPYRLKKLLGEGGMGVVWLAEREDTDNRVAIKFLPHAGLSPVRRERFAREIKTLAKLRHPFIARLYDAGALADGTPWFVMEFVEGERFTEYCKKQKEPVEERLRLFRRVCEAVQYAHGQEIIHRDLKPSNIMVEQDGTPRLLDFGIARELHSLDEPAEQTRAGLRFLSPDYAAPEWVHEGTVGFFTDVYSLGVILYEMLHGQRPQERAPEGMSGNDLDIVCQKAMHQDFRARYQSVEALIRDIDHYLKNEPLDARPDSFSYRLNKFVQRNRRPVIATALGFVVLVGLIVFFTVRLTKARNEAVAEAVRTKRVERFMLNLFNGGSSTTAPSTDLRVLTLLDRGVKNVAALESDPETQSDVYETLGGMYELLGNYQQADELLRRGLDRIKAAVGPDDPKVAEALSQLASLRGDQARYKEAEQLATQGLDLAKRRLPPNDPDVLAAESTLGRVEEESGAYEKAINLLEPIVRVAPSDEKGTYALWQSLSALAIAHFQLGHYQAAESVLVRTLALDRRFVGSQDPRTANDLMNLATAKSALGEYGEAEKFYQDGIEIFKAWYGPEHPDTATFESLFARLLVTEGKYAEADTVLQPVLTVQEHAYGKVHERVAVTLVTLGRIAVKRGNLSAAEADFSRALEIDRSLFGEQNGQTVGASSDLGDVLLRQGDNAKAEQLLQGAVKTGTALFPAGDAHVGFAQVRWGRALLRLKRFPEAETQLSAGYQCLQKQAHPPAQQIQEARQDLASVYEALHQPDKARQFR